MKKLLSFVIGSMATALFVGCSQGNGSQSKMAEVIADSVSADPPLGYVINLQPLGDFSRHGHYNYGIMGFSLRPGDACVVSTYRLKRKDDLWKVMMHEFLHSRGLPHCKKDDVKCLMQDAHSKNTFYMKHGLCEDCKKTLKSLLET